MTQVNRDVLTDLFSYHAGTPETNPLYDRSTELAVEYVLGISELVNNPAELTVILREFKKVKMMINEAITYDRYNLSYRQIFDEKA